MTEDKELKAMSVVFAELETLGAEERKRVMDWVSKKLAIDVPSSKPALPRHESKTENSFEADESLTTDTIANLMNAQSGPDLIMAAAAQLHLAQRKTKFTRHELVDEMRAAPGHFKETFVNNLSKYLVGLTKADRLRLVGQNTYAMSHKERQVMEAALADK